MSSEILMNARKIFDRLAETLALTKDRELADYLGVPAGTLASWKSRNVIDIETLIASCKDNVDWNYILTGFRNLKSSQETIVLDDEYCTIPYRRQGSRRQGNFLTRRPARRTGRRLLFLLI